MNLTKKDSLKVRVAKVKPLLRSMGDWRKVLMTKYPEYDTMKGYIRLKNVFGLSSCDETITERLEELAATLQAVEESEP